MHTDEEIESDIIDGMNLKKKRKKCTGLEEKKSYEMYGEFVNSEPCF